MYIYKVYIFFELGQGENVTAEVMLAQLSIDPRGMLISAIPCIEVIGTDTFSAKLRLRLGLGVRVRVRFIKSHLSSQITEGAEGSSRLVIFVSFKETIVFTNAFGVLVRLFFALLVQSFSLSVK